MGRVSNFVIDLFVILKKNLLEPYNLCIANHSYFLQDFYHSLGTLSVCVSVGVGHV